MVLTLERARTQAESAAAKLRKEFSGCVDCSCMNAEYLDASHKRAIGFVGLPYDAPVVEHALAIPEVMRFVRSTGEDLVFVWGDGTVSCKTTSGELALDGSVSSALKRVAKKIMASCGTLNNMGELELDLTSYPVGPHYAVNLLLGNRAGYAYPLFTTPKSAVDAFGRGSFRATGGEQVLATRCVLDPSQNGEPANRQFYITENGKQVFWSGDLEGVSSAKCTHSQSRTTIDYQTDDGLRIQRTIFLLPQQDGMPSAVEAQRVRVTNLSDHDRDLRIVMTGVFGIAGPETIANDVVYANIVQESEVCNIDGVPTAITLYAKPAEERNKKRFALLLCDGEPLEEYCFSEADFIGSGSLAHPELVGHLPSAHNRKMAPFFAMAKTFTVAAGATKEIDEFVGMSGADGDDVPFQDALLKLCSTYRDPEALDKALAGVQEFWRRYPSYLVPSTGDERFDSYVSHNLPFQVLYQTYVSRAFAWTQKSYRETGFREIQDIYASMYYLSAQGQNGLVRDLLTSWVCQVYQMGYANHDFTFKGKEPGDCSDDQLWLVQAVYRYVMLTGDTGYLFQEFPVAGSDTKRTLWDTLRAIITYSGCISVGAHGLPLLDKADWNDALKLDKVVYKGPQKEELYRKQLERTGQKWGVAWENTQSESVMNACLLKIAADEYADLAWLVNRNEDGSWAQGIADKVSRSVQANAWKGDYFARCLINDGREGGYTYLGATGDGLAMDPNAPGTYFLNSYSWSILAHIATQKQIAKMLDVVEKYLKTQAGLKLCTLVDFDRLGVATGTALYFPGDRENSGVFKHAAMMATVASLQAARTVSDDALAERLANLAYFMIDRTLPYKTLDNPFVLKGNPRFCTQYNNSETCENVGPMLSGTASWLTLAVFEGTGAFVHDNVVRIEPVLRPGQTSLSFSLNLDGTTLDVRISAKDGKFRTGGQTTYLLDGKTCNSTFARPASGRHVVDICL